jgi:uncharacterized protein (DUF362 family)
MTKNRVVICHGQNIQKRTIKALEELAPVLPKTGTKILIKPNLVEPSPATSGNITRPELIEGILQFLGDKYQIFIGESSGSWNTWQAFEKAGYLDLARTYKAQLVNFDEGDFVEIKTTNPLWPRFEIAQLVKEVDYLISAAVLKEHPYQVTLTLKNIMGILRPQKDRQEANKHYIHQENDKEIWAKRLCLLLKQVKVDLGVVDGTTAMFGSHIDGRLEKKDLTIVGEPLAVDFVSAEILGHPKVFYLEMALSQELGKRPNQVDSFNL